MKKVLRKRQNRAAKGTKRISVIAVADPYFGQRILSRYRVARKWRFPTISFRSAGIRSVARTINFSLSIVFRISPNLRAGGGPSSIVAEKRSSLSFLERLTESRETVSILSLQPPRSWQEPQERDAAQVNRGYASKQGMMTEKTAGKRMISRNRLEGSGDIRVTAQVSLPLLSLIENRVQPRGRGKEEAGIWREKVPYQMGAVLQRTISDPHEDGSRRRCRPGRVMPALYPSGSVQNAPLQTDSGSLHFRSFKRLEQEIDVIRKTMADTREALSEQSRSRWMPAADTLKSVTDLNLLSDHVYRELERRIRAERERRGL